MNKQTNKQNILKKFSFTALAALMIAACSSGGGGGSDDHQPQNNASNNTSTNQPTNNQAQRPTQPASNATGGAYILSGEDNSDKVTVTPVALTNYNKTVLNVDGKSILIGSPGIIAGTWFVKEGNTTINGQRFSHDVAVCCGKYTDTTFGIAIGKDPSQNDYFFYNGNPTQNMPTAGTAKYAGEALIQDERFDDDIFGKSQFEVDFSNKKLSGSLTSNIEPIKIEGNISGNSFNGSAKSDAWGSQGVTEGKFYGNNAKEMSGIVNGGDRWGAVFGAQKQ